MRVLAGLFLLLPAAEDHPLSPEKRAELRKRFDEAIARWTRAIEAEPGKVEYYSRRGDAYFFRGRFKEAAADYDRMVELRPAVEAQHWRWGIAFFYAGEYRKAARQFEVYHTFDDVDRENGIWRYLSQAKAYGIGKAREGLLKYRKDDREPFPSVYELFAGKTTAEAILEEIRTAKVDGAEREKRYFYAHLYIGLNAVIEGKPKAARASLRRAVANTWGPDAGYGPAYMWHVGRVHYRLLASGGSED